MLLILVVRIADITAVVLHEEAGPADALQLLQVSARVQGSSAGGSRKIKPKRRNGGTQALREEAAKSGARARHAPRVGSNFRFRWPSEVQEGRVFEVEVKLLL